MEKMYTTAEAAERIGLEAKTLINYRTRGCGPAYVALSRKAVRYRESALEAYLDRHTVTPREA